MVKYYEKNNFKEASVLIVSVLLAFSHKTNMPLNKYKKYTVFMLLLH